ncbi:MAG TPA: hypothetical protein VJI32_00865, partial [Candidatus Nanoarchaeia archaeon]|nr:hypothetical protein [Candidatus Nanoarchaeia archaeon]
MEEVFNFPYAPRLARLLWASVAEPLQKTLTDLLTSPAEFSLRDGFSVLMVDMQSWFLDDFDEVTRNRIIRSQCDVLNFCIRYGIPIAVLEYAH